MTIDQHLVLSNSLTGSIERAVADNILPPQKVNVGIDPAIIMQNIERWVNEKRQTVESGKGATEYFENAITIAKEELYIEDLMINGMRENF